MFISSLISHTTFSNKLKYPGERSPNAADRAGGRASTQFTKTVSLWKPLSTAYCSIGKASSACAAHDDQSAGREANRYNARHGTLTSASIGKSQSKLGVCGIAAEAGEAAGPPRTVGPEVNEPR